MKKANHNHCPALLISAPASGQGKTTFTAALARYHRNQGHNVRVFKTGPDFLDPMILEQACGNPVYQLDLWMVGEQACKQQLYEAAADADLILIEGVMGLFDGKPSSADLAELFDIPVLALIDASAMAQTFGALAYGLAHYRPALPFAGVVANRVASQGHGEMLAESLPDSVNYFGGLLRNEAITLPERHLGLVQAEEVDDLENRLNHAAELITQTKLTSLPGKVIFETVNTQTTEPLLKNIKIGIARDAAFAFIYPANLDVLKEMRAELIFFSPLTDKAIPEVDAIWLPGGYPELHLAELEQNKSMFESIQQHYNNDKPILAECGGMLYLTQSLTDKEGKKADMVGLLPADGKMQSKLAGLGMQQAPLPEGDFTAHTFHHSLLETDMEPVAHGVRQRGNNPGEAIYRSKALTATYLHLYFSSNTLATAKLFK
ncbi:MAG: cobyrinate a,c-diamide synthase [Gammaproteobacteria bacterium]|nr:cobyrinate a,c-diamide synthase [Gammaproteobacteria bacterium]